MPEGLVAIAAMCYLAWASFAYLVMLALSLMPIALAMGFMFLCLAALWKWRKT
jgi:hypothetical protein